MYRCRKKQHIAVASCRLVWLSTRLWNRNYGETVVLKLAHDVGIDLPRRVLCGIHLCIRPLHSVVLTGAGSLAVILQPAFFPFGLAVEYLLLQCLFMPLLVACAV